MDPSQESRKPSRPQTWNRYAYARGNPLNRFDPDGRADMGSGFSEEINTPCGDRACPATDPVRRTLNGLMAGAYGLPLLSAVGAGGVAGATSSSSLAEALGAAYRLNPFARGNLIESILAGVSGGALPRTFPVIDRFLNGVATSVKSLDLAAKTYQNVGNLTSRLQGFVNKLAGFQFGQVGNAVVRGRDITSRVLEIVIQQKSLTEEQAIAIRNLGGYAAQNGVTIRVIVAK